MIPFNALSMIIVVAVFSTSDGLRLHPDSVYSSLPPVSQNSSALEVALREWADEVRHAADTSSADSVVLTMANQKYRNRFDEVLNSFGKMAGAPLAVVALDEETERFFRGRGVPCFWFNPDKFGLSQWHWPGYPLKESVMRGKFEATAYLLEAGLQVVFTEMDIYWKRNPLTLLSGFAADFLVTQHDSNDEINIGFYIAKPTPTVKHTFSKVRAWAAQQDRYDAECGCMDQKILDFAVRGSGQLVDKCGFPDSEQAKLFDNASLNLNWAYIPYSRLSHWPLPEDVEHNDQVVAVHVWSKMGPPSCQMDWAQHHGFWASGSPMTHHHHHLHCHYNHHHHHHNNTYTRTEPIERDFTADGHVCGCDDFS